MILRKRSVLLLPFLVIACYSTALAADQYVVVKDPQAVSIASKALAAFLKMSDPLKPMLDDVVNVRLCGDVTSRFKSIEHGWMVLVYSRTSPRKNYDCPNVVAIYPVRPPEESIDLQ